LWFRLEKGRSRAGANWGINCRYGGVVKMVKAAGSSRGRGAVSGRREGVGVWQMMWGGCWTMKRRHGSWQQQKRRRGEPGLETQGLGRGDIADADRGIGGRGDVKGREWSKGPKQLAPAEAEAQYAEGWRG
jgi:hypothetical protein